MASPTLQVGLAWDRSHISHYPSTEGASFRDFFPSGSWDSSETVTSIYFSFQEYPRVRVGEPIGTVLLNLGCRMVQNPQKVQASYVQKHVYFSW